MNGFKAYQAYWQEHPDRDDAWADSMRSQLGEERFQREIECVHGDSVVSVKFPDGKVKDLTVTELALLLRS